MIRFNTFCLFSKNNSCTNKDNGLLYLVKVLVSNAEGFFLAGNISDCGFLCGIAQHV
jgi:hypothetical protein